MHAARFATLKKKRYWAGNFGKKFLLKGPWTKYTGGTAQHFKHYDTHIEHGWLLINHAAYPHSQIC